MLQRNAKGQFIKGNKEGMSSTEIARERQLKSAKVRHDNCVARKTLVDTLREELTKSAGAGTGMTKQEYLVAKCLANLADKDARVFPKDLKTLAEVLGEMEQKVNLKTEDAGLIIGFKKADND